MPTNPDPQALRELLEKATPRPWRHSDMSYNFSGTMVCWLLDSKGQQVGRTQCSDSEDERTFVNAQLITAAVNALPALLDRLAEQDKVIGKLREFESLGGADIPTPGPPDFDMDKWSRCYCELRVLIGDKQAAEYLDAMDAAAAEAARSVSGGTEGEDAR